MELGIRDWMWVIGVLLLLAVLLDGFRRASRERKNQVRLSRNAKRGQRYRSPPVEEFPTELPGGPARVVSTDSLKENVNIEASNEVLADSSEMKSEKIVWTTKPKKHAPIIALNVESMASAPEPLSALSAEPIFTVSEDTLFSTSITQEVDVLQATAEDDEKIMLDALVISEPEVLPVITEVEQETEIIVENFSNDFSEPDSVIETLASDESRVEEKVDDPLFSEPYKNNKAEHIQPSLFEGHAEQEEIITLNVISKSILGFAGEDLLHILLACDCRFGAMNIFHRYESKNAQGQIQFSIVNVVEPGIFKLENIKNFYTPGVCFFIRLPGPKDPNDAFKCMLETARCLVKNLDGELQDENRQIVTSKIIDAKRKRIRDFKKRKK